MMHPRFGRGLTRWLILGSGLALLGAACSGGSATPTSVAPTTTTMAMTSTSAGTTAPMATTTSAAMTTSTTAPAPTTTTSTTTPPPTTTILPGEPIDIGPRRGDVLSVVGVAHDDTLNVRSAPGVDQPVVTTLDPLTDDVVALGRSRMLPNSIWIEVEANGVIGWASWSFLAFPGVTNDDTAAVVASLGAVPAAETMLELGRIVAEAEASTEPRSRITMTVAPTVGDLGEVVYDVIGLGDDALAGLRLHVIAQPNESGEGFSLEVVEATALCGRGVTADGLCL